MVDKCKRLYPEFIDRFLDLKVTDFFGTSKQNYEDRAKDCGKYQYPTHFLPSPVSYEQKIVGHDLRCEGQLLPDFLNRIADACPSCESTYEERNGSHSQLACRWAPVFASVPKYLNDNEKRRVEIFEKAMRKDKF